jgi:hypothetical protein
MGKKYEVLSFYNLKKLNEKAKWKKFNQYIADNVMEDLKKAGRKIAVVVFQFLHNETEQRLVLFAGEKYGNLLLDVDLKDTKLITTVEMEAA